MSSNADARRRAALAALSVTMLWSSSWVIIRVGMADENLPPLTFAGLRYAGAALVLVVVTAMMRRTRAEMRAMSAATLRRLALLGLVFYAITQGAQFVAIEAQPVATTSLALSLTPLLVATASGPLLGEPPSSNLLLGAVLVPIGAAAYLSGGLGATATGMTAAVVALGANVTASLFGRSVNRADHSSPLVTTSVSMTVGSIVLLGVGFSRGRFRAIVAARRGDHRVARHRQHRPRLHALEPLVAPPRRRRVGGDQQHDAPADRRARVDLPRRGPNGTAMARHARRVRRHRDRPTTGAAFVTSITAAIDVVCGGGCGDERHVSACLYSSCSRTWRTAPACGRTSRTRCPTFSSATTRSSSLPSPPRVAPWSGTRATG